MPGASTLTEPIRFFLNGTERQIAERAFAVVSARTPEAAAHAARRPIVSPDAMAAPIEDTVTRQLRITIPPPEHTVNPVAPEAASRWADIADNMAARDGFAAGTPGRVRFTPDGFRFVPDQPSAAAARTDTAVSAHARSAQPTEITMDPSAAAAWDRIAEIRAANRGIPAQTPSRVQVTGTGGELIPKQPTTVSSSASAAEATAGRARHAKPQKRLWDRFTDIVRRDLDPNLEAFTPEGRAKIRNPWG